MSDIRFKNSFNNSPNANVVMGDGNQPHPQEHPQELHCKKVAAAQAALKQERDEIRGLGDGVFEALGQFLALASKIQIDQRDLRRTQSHMNEILDEAWAKHTAKELRAPLLPGVLEVSKILASSEVMKEVAKKLISGSQP